MQIEEIGEPIRMLADCAGGRIDPVRFRWGGRTYSVQAINGRWVDRQAGGYALHYSLQCNGETYYVHFASDQVQWWLDKVVLAG